MKPRVSPELEGMADAVEILSPTRFRVGERICEVGGPQPLFVPSQPEPATVATPQGALRQALANELYCRCYTRTQAVSPPPPDLVAHRDHLVALSGANTGTGSWEPGWRVRGLTADGRVEVEGFGLVFVAAAGEVRPEGKSLASGAACRVRVPGEMRTLRPGFYCANGDADGADPAGLPWLLRLYWHLRPSGAAVWLQILTGGLNRRGVPFRLKVVADPRFYLRADAGVLSLEPEHYRAARPVLREAYRTVESQLRPSVPGLTRRLAPGLGLAEGPADGTTFGGHRCGLVAEALVELGAGASDARSRVEAVAARFRAAGLDPAHPYRAPGSASRYQPLARSDRRRTRPASARVAERSAPDPPKTADPLETANRIGDALCHTAYRADGRCNWIGRAFVADPQGGGLGPAVAALGATLYGGTAGIALFLAELHARTGDPMHRDTALAAIRQALVAAARGPGRNRPVGYFEGQLGIAWSARRVAALTGHESLAAEAANLVSWIARELPGEHRWDLLEGNAGAVLAFLRLYEETGDWTLLEAASRLGRELVPSALALGAAATGHGPLPLTGFAHGAAGAGLALLELSVAIGDAGLRYAADQCFAYEESCFDPELGNWPDYRGVARETPGVPVEPAGFMTAWCHGAPGIALSRLRAMEVDPDRAPSYEPAARAGLQTTAEELEGLVRKDRPEPCLCHGLAGLADVAQFGGRVLGEPALETLAMSAMERLAALYSMGPGQLPGETDRLGDPALLTGEAGVGHALLRVDEPERIATLLLPGEIGVERQRPSGRHRQIARGHQNPAEKEPETATP